MLPTNDDDGDDDDDDCDDDCGDDCDDGNYGNDNDDAGYDER